MTSRAQLNFLSFSFSLNLLISSNFDQSNDVPNEKAQLNAAVAAAVAAASLASKPVAISQFSGLSPL